MRKPILWLLAICIAVSFLLAACCPLPLPARNPTPPPVGPQLPTSAPRVTTGPEESALPPTATSVTERPEPTFEAGSGVVAQKLTDASGAVEFEDPTSGEPVAITVVSTSGDPIPSAEVTYVHGEGFEVFFVKDPEGTALIGAGFYPYNSEHTIVAEINLPYHLQEMTPEEAEAAQRYCDAFGYCDEVSYVGTISYEDYRQRTVRAGWVVIVELKLLQWLLTGAKLPFVSTMPMWGETQADLLIGHRGQWDVYEWFDNGCRCEGGSHYPSQSPTITGLDVEVENSSATFYWEAADPARYPNGFVDYTIFKAGPTRFSDIAFHYRIETAGGQAVLDWQTTTENSVTVGDLSPGDYAVIVYANDDVSNESETRAESFQIAEEAAPAPAGVLRIVSPPAGTTFRPRKEGLEHLFDLQLEWSYPDPYGEQFEVQIFNPEGSGVVCYYPTHPECMTYGTGSAQPFYVHDRTGVELTVRTHVLSDDELNRWLRGRWTWRVRAYDGSWAESWFIVEATR